jgi:hypothetical protein
LRGIYPIVATVSADGFVRVEDDELKQRYEAIAEAVRESPLGSEEVGGVPS